MALWDLRDLSTPPYAWGDFQDNIGLVKDGAGKITSFRNKGTAGGRWTPPDNNAANAPTLATVAGRQMAVYSSAEGINQSLSLDVQHVDTPMTIVAVWKSTAGARREYQTIVDFSRHGQVDTRLTGNNVNFSEGKTFIDSGNTTLLSGTDQPDFMNVLIFELNGGSSKMYLNGVETTFSPSSRYETYGLMLGGTRDGITSAFDGAIGEIAAIQGTFSGDEWERLTQATMWKWGKEAAIPTGAKYKAAAPTRPARRVRMDEQNQNFYCVLSNNGLMVQGTQGTNTPLGALSTDSRKGGKFYFEVTLTSTSGNGVHVGIADPSLDIVTANSVLPGQNATDRRGVSFHIGGVRYPYVDGDRPDLSFDNNGNYVPNDPGLLRDVQATLPLTYGIAFDCDLGRFDMQNDAGWIPRSNPADPTAGLRTAVREAIVYLGGSQFDNIATINFGDTPFLLPVPAGYLPWQITPVTIPTIEVISELQLVGNFGDNGDPSQPITRQMQFPAGPALIVFQEGDERLAWNCAVDGVLAPRLTNFANNKRHHYFVLPDQGVGGSRTITLTCANGGFWRDIAITVLKVTGVDTSTVVGTVSSGVQFTDGNSYPQTGYGSLGVPPGGIGVVTLTSYGDTQGARWLDDTRQLPSSLPPLRRLVLASMPEGSRMHARVQQYSGEMYSGISFAPEQAVVTTTGILNVTEADDFVVSQSINKITASTLAQEVNDSVSSQGFLKVVATTSLVEAGDTLSSTSKVILRATASIQESGDFMSSQTVNRVTGRVNVSLDADTVSSTAIVQVKAATTVIEDSDTVASNSIARVSARLSVTENDDTLIAASQSYLRALVNTSDGEDTLTSNVATIIKATALLSTDDDSINSTARVFVSGVGNMTESDDTLIAVSGTGSLALYADMFEQSDQVFSDARVILSGFGSTTDGNDTTTALMQIVINAQGAVVEASDSLVSTAIARASANASLAEDNDAVSASAKVAVRTYTVITEDSDIVTSTYFQSVFYASGSLIEEDDCLDSTVRVLATIQSNLLDDDDSLNSLVRLRLNAATITQEENDLMVSQTVTRIAANSTMVEADDSVTAKLSVFYPIVTPDTRLVVVALPASRRATIPVGESRHAVVVAASRNATIPALASRHAVL